MKQGTGDKKLDILLDGGLDQKSNILVVSPPGEIKKTFALQFMREGLSIGQTGIIIDYDTPIADIERFFSGASNPPLIIDGYSWTLGSESRSRYNVQGPTALNDLSILLSHILEKSPGPKRVVFNSLSTLLLYNDPDTIYKFTQIIGARLKNSDATALFLLESGMHSDASVTTIEHIMDDIITFKYAGKSWKMRIRSMGDNPITVEESVEGVRIP